MELKKTCIQFGFSENISDLVVWQINGDNMAPNINRKDFLLINTRVKQIDGSGIYAFLDDTKVIIRRVKEGLNGKIDLINDNSAYQGYENIQMLNFEIGNLEVLGRVVFVGKIL
jgi:phage repressor protein C with HTH and peptisase S24 domain